MSYVQYLTRYQQNINCNLSFYLIFHELCCIMCVIFKQENQEEVPKILKQQRA